MTFADFTLEDVIAKLGVSPVTAELFPDLKPVTVPGWLKEALAYAPPPGAMYEKARSEFLVAPVLAAARALTDFRLAIFSGQLLSVEPAAGLTGECDFILAAGPQILPVRGPILTIVEAKRGDIELGLGQGIAQTVAARRFNEASGVRDRPVYGCVTSGELWQFIRLNGPAAEIDLHRYYIADVGGILAVLLTIAGAAFSAQS